MERGPKAPQDRRAQEGNLPQGAYPPPSQESRSYQITIENFETGKTIEVEASDEEVLAILFGKDGSQTKQPRATPPRKAPGKRGRHRKEEAVDHEEPEITGATPKKGEEIRRLLKESDATPAEIAQRVGCSTTYVHMVRNAMERDGELP